MANDLRARLSLKDGGPVKMADGGADLRTRLKLGGGGEVHMQDGGRLPPGIKRATERAKESKSV